MIPTRAQYSPGRLGQLLLLVACMDGHFLVEQPGSSLFFHYVYIREAFALLKLAGLKARDEIRWVYMVLYISTKLTTYNIRFEMVMRWNDF